MNFSIKALFRKAKRFIIRVRWRPIRVFCLHHISDNYSPAICSEGDWVSTVSFENTILQLEKKYSFISLVDAHRKLKRDLFRFRRYAVLTFDDGNSSVFSSLKWLEQRGIPYTLFLNTKYFDGVSCSPHILKRARSYYSGIDETEVAKDRYLSRQMLEKLSPVFSSFASHGFEHFDATILSSYEFERQLDQNLVNLNNYPQSIPFHAYTWGRHSKEIDTILREKCLVPVLMDGGKNYNDSSCIHRELFPAVIEV